VQVAYKYATAVAFHSV